MQNDKSISGISCGLVDSNVFEWEVMLMIDDDTKFYGGTYIRGWTMNMPNQDYRRLLSRTTHVPTRIPTTTTKDAL
jgi:hypothetical protein